VSKVRRGGLGKGLGALIPTAPSVIEPAEAHPDGRRDTTVAGVATAALDPSLNSKSSTDAESEHSEPGLAGDRQGPVDESASTGRKPVDILFGGSVGHVVSNTRSESSSASDDEPQPVAYLHQVPGATFLEIPVERIVANARQPRTVFDDEALEELAHSVREFGVLQPIVVRPSGDNFELVMGERRLRAAAAAGLTEIPAIVRDTADDAMLRDALLENIHRAQLNPLEEAAAYQQLLEEFGVTHEELATRIGRSRSQVSNTVRLMNLSIPVQRRVAAGVLSAGHARALLALADASAQDELAGRIVAEGLSVRATEELVSLAAKGGLAAVKRRPVRRITAPAAADLAEKLSDTFDTKVRVEIGKRKGKITVEFATIADLERIVSVMAPQLQPRRAVQD
jgi:ParB family chromosome partitioning protein